MISWSYYCGWNLENDRNPGGLTAILHRRQQADRQRRIAEMSVPLQGMRVGFYLFSEDCYGSPLLDMPKMASDYLERCNIVPLYLHPGKARSLSTSSSNWADGVMLGQEMDMIFVGSCGTWDGNAKDHHEIRPRYFFPNGYEVKQLRYEYGIPIELLGITENAGYATAYQNLLEKTILQILEALQVVKEWEGCPDPHFHYDPSEWYEGFTLPTIEANRDLLTFG